MTGVSGSSAPELVPLANQVLESVREVDRELELRCTMLARLFYLDPRGVFLRTAVLELRPMLALEESKVARLREALRAVEEAAAAEVCAMRGRGA